MCDLHPLLVLGVLTCKVGLSGRFLSLQLSPLHLFKTCLLFVSVGSQLRLVPTALTACFVKDEVI